MDRPWELDIADFIVLAAAVTGTSDPVALRKVTNIPLAESALKAPFASFGGKLFYDDSVEQAAILCSRIIRNHPLPDGNKRAAYLSMKVQLEANGYQWVPPDEDEAVNTIEALAARDIDERQFIEWVKHYARES